MPRKPHPDEDNLEFDLGDLSAPIKPSDNPIEPSDKPIEPYDKAANAEVLNTVADVPI